MLDRCRDVCIMSIDALTLTRGNLMKNLETIKGLKIDKLERMNSSINGNPRFRVYFSNGLVSQTMVDDMATYAIENYTRRNRPVVDVEFGTHYGTVQVNRIVEAA